jgi:hypothetical protein
MATDVEAGPAPDDRRDLGAGLYCHISGRAGGGAGDQERRDGGGSERFLRSNNPCLRLLY